jgi:chemotaxis protein histidine kinase CheA/CheY-like chemotaxis protein
MLPEQQQRILGYFIEEARDHVNTIEQGLLNLEGTLNDPEMISEVFRAAHSIKGGAAMLGLTSIQHTSHRLEDCFKVLKDNPVQIDQKLESLFLGVSDTLKALLEHLSGPYGLSEDAANTLMSETEPVFQWLYEHLDQLVQQASSGVARSSVAEELHSGSLENVSTLTELFLRRDIPDMAEDGYQESPEMPFSVAPQEVHEARASVSAKENNWSEFQTQVLQTLREMLQFFKQTTTSSTRQNLQECCYQLVKLGETWNLSKWCALCQAAARAIANPENTYLTLAKIVITEIKQAQELVLQGREAEIVISQQLEALLSLAEIELLQKTSDLVDEQSTPEPIVAENNEQLFITNFSEPIEEFNLEENTSEHPSFDLQETSSNAGLTSFSFIPHEEAHPISSNHDPNGPEVGIAELNTLADLFEGETPELDESWHQEETLDITTTDELGIDFSSSETEDADGDLSDLLSFDRDTSNEQQTTSAAKTQDLSLLFGDNFLEKENSPAPNQQISAATTELSAINELDLNLDADSDEILQEFTEISSDTKQPIDEIVQNNIDENGVVADLLALTLDDDNELLIISEVTPPENEAIASVELSTNKENSLDNLFLETEQTNWVEEITPSDYIELTQPTGLSLDNLFGDIEEHSLLPTTDSEIGNLFDIPPETASAFSQSEDDLSNFWNQETIEEQQNQLNVEKALEESFFAAVADDIFADSQQAIASPQASFDLEDFDLNFSEEEQLLSSNFRDDLFEELAPSNLNIFSENKVLASLADSTAILEGSLPSLAQHPVGEEIPSLSQQPEALDFIPEFTNQPPEISAVDSPDVELNSFDENPQLLFEDVAIYDSTYIQMDITESTVDHLSITETSLDIFSESSPLFPTNPEILDSEDPNLETVFQFRENIVIENEEVSFTNNLLFTETPFLEPELEEDSLNEFAETFIQENIEPGKFAFLLAENPENLAEDLWDIGEISETVLASNEENPVVQTEEITEIEPVEIVAPEDEFANLEALLGEEIAPIAKTKELPEIDFAALEELLATDNNEASAKSSDVYDGLRQRQPLTIQPVSAKNAVPSPRIDEFGDLEKLLAEADQTISHSTLAKSNSNQTARPSTRRAARFEETMKVPVKQLDDMSNLVGELVVNRNTLEQDHERLRQSLDNLLIQVQQLSDVGARMQELYERSLLEASLLAGRKKKDSGFQAPDANTDRGFSELEMDRFTPFHTLSQQMIERIVRVRESASDIDFVTEETERVARQFRQVTTQLQEGLTRARMVHFAQTIDRWRRGVRDNAIKCGKQVELVIEGGDTLIDKMILDHLTDPLTHMLNNAIAHGIETPEERQATGKPPVGIITIRAFHQGNQTIISVGDDGAGIDSAKVKAKAVKIGMITEAQAKTMSRPEVYDLLFQSGFTIKDQADEISGRGVGMDVVRSEISEIRGTVNTDSAIGKGTTFTIRLPLTLSICKALCCVSDRARVAFPMDGVEDTLDIPLKSIQHDANGQSFISWRDTVLPFRPLKELLTFNRQISRGNVYGGTRDDDMVSVVVVRSANTLIALQIDLVLSEQEIVIKQFEGPAPKPIGVAGATVLGDGRIMPIADVLEIIDIFYGRISTQLGGNSWQQQGPVETLPAKIDPTVLIVDDSITVRELLSLTFNKAGYRVEQARDGQEAWDKLRSGLPCDIVFCDIEMPRCDGLELLSRIQKDSNLNHLPIAMLTSRGADKHRQMAVQLGASGYFTKPYLEEALLEAAGRMLKGEKLVS